MKIVFLFIFFMAQLSANEKIKIDYDNGNDYRKNYEKVPDNELIWAKIQAAEPRYMFEGPLKGKGLEEPAMNYIINQLRKEKISVYSDYFTTAKLYFYMENRKYSLCSVSLRENRVYKKMFLDSTLLKTKTFNKHLRISVPLLIYPPVYPFAIIQSKVKAIEKHKFPGTQIYSVKALIDDTNLKTIQIKDRATSIKEIIYIHPELDRRLKPEYKYRVYDFVASNNIQIPLMLRAKRMDWVDISNMGDFYFKQIKLGYPEVSFLESSLIHPDLLTDENLSFVFVRCIDENLEKLEKTMKIINQSVKKLRGNLEFWTKVLTQYAIDFNIPYVGPEEFYETKESFRRSHQLRSGYFDYKEK